ncbi:MAG: 50S ribosomal protein L28 [Bacillota bacterium]|nr:50S ribosomal protein L28 [Bacillota bacterium]
MAKVCEICGKGIGFGNKVSHSNRKSRRSWAPNIQSVRAIVHGTPKTINVCTRCIRSGKIERNVQP